MSNEDKWYPEFGEKYWFISGWGNVCSTTCKDQPYDFNRYNNDNMFKTKEEAEWVMEYEQ